MLYLIENNGVYGLTKGQFSASADIGSTAKKGEANLATTNRSAVSWSSRRAAASWPGVFPVTRNSSFRC